MIRLCMRDLLPCLLKLLNLNNKDKETTEQQNGKAKLASSGSNWKKLKAPIKSYVDDMLNVKKYKLFIWLPNYLR